jgi:uncharacterized phiE125 gp8 family phage protein
MAMGYAPTRYSAPNVKPVSVIEARRHCRVSTAVDDELFEALIDVAVQHFDGWNGVLGRCMISQTWDQHYDDFKSMVLPFPTLTITTVKYDDVNDAEQLVSSSDYALRKLNTGTHHIAPLAPFTWPLVSGKPEAVRVRFVAGFGPSASDVPAPIRQALLLTIGTMYSNTKADVGLRRVVIDGVGSHEWDSTGMLLKANEVAIDRLIAPYRLVSR